MSLYGDSKDKYQTPKGVIPYNKSNRQNFYTRLDYDFSEDHSLTFDYTYNRSRNVSGGKGQQHSKLPTYYKKIFDVNPSLLHSAYLSYNGHFSDLFSLHATVGGGNNNMSYQYGLNGDDGGDLNDYLSGRNHVEMKNRFLYSEVRGTLNLLPQERLRVLMGVQSKSTKLDWPAEYYYGGSLAGYHIKEQETYIAPYAQVEYKPLKELLFITGIRHDSYRYDKSLDKSSTSPRFSLSYMPFAGSAYDYTTLWASYSEAFNPPSAAFLIGVGSFVQGNPNLKPEKAKGIEVGVKQRIGYIANVEMSYFDTDYTNMISTRFVGGRVIPLNIAKAEVKGIEAKLELYPLPWLGIHLGYTGMSQKDKLTNKKITGKPNRIMQYGVSIEDLNGFYASLLGYSYGDYRNTQGLASTLGEKHPSEGDIVWNLKASYKYQLSGEVMAEPFVSVNNLGDKVYYTSSDSPLMIEGRNYLAGVNFKMRF